jgi:hypothetical protein
MRPWQNALAIIGGFLVGGALLPWPARYRLACAVAAIAIVLILFVARLRAHGKREGKRARADALSAVERIRAERAKRFGRR